MFLFEAKARVSEVLLDPGDIHAFLTPRSANLETNKSLQTIFRLIDIFIFK